MDLTRWARFDPSLCVNALGVFRFRSLMALSADSAQCRSTPGAQAFDVANATFLSRNHHAEATNEALLAGA
jgi:hypothetical protein